MVERITDRTARVGEGASPDFRSSSLNGADLVADGRAHFARSDAGRDTTLPVLRIRDGARDRAQLSDRILEREKEIERKYPGVQFVSAGETLGNKIDGKTGVEISGQPLHARTPRMSELDALDKALANSRGAYHSADGKPLKVGFTNDEPVTGVRGKDAPGAEYQAAGTAHSDFATLRIFPAASLMPATQKDLPSSRRSEFSAPQTLEAVLNHELGHASQDRIGGLEASADAAYKREAGWVPLHNPPSDKENDWALKGKDGYLYKLAGSPGQEQWLRLQGGGSYDSNGNYTGQFLDRFGKLLGHTGGGLQDPPQAAAIDTPTMRSRALITPVGMYFPNPQEEMAEALRAYRTSPETRAAFRAQNLELYRVAERLDEASAR